MTNSLIPVFNGSISNVSIQLCNARELHSFLEIGKQYGTWITDRITDYGFVQDEDYIIVTSATAGRPRKEYHITLDMGKELAMVERNEKGRQIRKYFIECEREMKRLQNSAEIQPLAPALPKHSTTAALGLRSLLPLVIYYRDVSQMAKEFNEICRQLGRGRHSGLSAVLHNYASAFDDNAALVRKVRGVLLTQFGQLPQDDQDYLRDFIEL